MMVKLVIAIFFEIDQLKLSLSKTIEKIIAFRADSPKNIFLFQSDR